MSQLGNLWLCHQYRATKKITPGTGYTMTEITLLIASPQFVYPLKFISYGPNNMLHISENTACFRSQTVKYTFPTSQDSI